MTAASAPRPGPCAVSLIDRHTGTPCRINGAPLVLFTRTPDAAIADLMERRDAARWYARVEPLCIGA